MLNSSVTFSGWLHKGGTIRLEQGGKGQAHSQWWPFRSTWRGIVSERRPKKQPSAGGEEVVSLCAPRAVYVKATIWHAHASPCFYVPTDGTVCESVFNLNDLQKDLCIRMLSFVVVKSCENLNVKRLNSVEWFGMFFVFFIVLSFSLSWCSQLIPLIADIVNLFRYQITLAQKSIN